MLTLCRIQEGMIFVSMSQDELLERTAQYQIQYSPSHRHRPRHSQIRLQPSHAYFNSVRSPFAERTFLADPTEYYSRGHSEQPLSARSQGFRVTTDFDDRSDDGEDPEWQDDLEAIEQALNFQYVDAELLCSDDDEESDVDIPGHVDASYEQPLRALNRLTAESRRLDLQTRSMRRRMTPSLIEPTGREAAINQALGEPPEVLKPHARFFIQRDKNTVSIKFDPPA